MNVKMLGTTDDPIDSLNTHKGISDSKFATKFTQAGVQIDSLKNRMGFFHNNDCHIAEHSLETAYFKRVSSKALVLSS